ncbi:MAG: uroporphyrinogen-III synthase, partial [Gammaproteobacteria bacterium]|nr:uroporphyrinogen-III synthase [Gammaproteobacteria bacterium]
MGDPVSGAAPLAGVRVVTTRGASGDERLRTLLEVAGAEVLVWPTSEYPPPRDPRPLEAARARLDRFDWVVFT